MLPLRHLLASSPIAHGVLRARMPGAIRAGSKEFKQSVVPLRPERRPHIPPAFHESERVGRPTVAPMARRLLVERIDSRALNGCARFYSASGVGPRSGGMAA